jgi:hypothetical protein
VTGQQIRARHGLALAGIALLAVSVAGCGSSSGSGDDANANGAPAAVAPAPQRCVGLWDGAANDVRGTLADPSFGDSYVSVGFASNYPDRCLITFSFPNLPIAWQYLEGGMGSSWTMLAELKPVALDESVTHWNASLGEDGSIASGATLASSPDAQTCVQLWNQVDNSSRLNVANGGVGADTYASVGFATPYPDKCLVTVSQPLINSAAQYLQRDKGPWTQSSIDPTTLAQQRWNATVGNDGSLALK